MNHWPDAIVVLLAVICTVTDIRKRKIYNAVIFPALAVAVAGHGWTGGWEAVLASITGLSAGLGLLLVPYILGGMGAGDVKLLAVIGALQGTAFALSTAVYMAIIGLIMSLAYLSMKPNTRGYLKQLGYTLYAWRSGLRLPLPAHDRAFSATMPYGVAIAGGALLALFWKGVIL